MDTKNVLLAIILSSVVLISWAVFFEPPVVEQQPVNKQITKDENTSAPSIEEIETTKEISRNEAINNVERIKLENTNIQGSISLEGALIDDIIFKNFKKSLKSNDNVIFLNPKSSNDGYYIETGWASGGSEKSTLPLDNTLWRAKNNIYLSPNNPVVLEWDNGEGLIFTKKLN